MIELKSQRSSDHVTLPTYMSVGPKMNMPRNTSPSTMDRIVHAWPKKGTNLGAGSFFMRFVYTAARPARNPAAIQELHLRPSALEQPDFSCDERGDFLSLSELGRGA